MTGHFAGTELKRGGSLVVPLSRNNDRFRISAARLAAKGQMTAKFSSASKSAIAVSVNSTFVALSKDAYEIQQPDFDRVCDMPDVVVHCDGC